ncbi:hypothetical protein GOP47_0012519 [Adiantum capillus-veneris]|uniref:ER membrane protein complex subunit 7 beta-sandwich domain-containing protein n=1 Tax=Adiantum capillus-veneris TaxID=13818 RepID=A0A9D4ZED8_ADICA|nr:hypothetical protein GOP47_0012519 [Adiantum capillus-veneris]
MDSFTWSSLLAISLLSCLTTSIAASGLGGYTIDGRIQHSRTQGLGGNVVPFKTSNVKIVLNSGQKVAFIRPDGYFAFTGIPAGTHLLEVIAPGYFFSPVRVDVSARQNGQLQATLTETRRILSEPLVLEPLREEAYFEKREPFSLMGLLKSPMGLMVGFMAFAAFLLPKLMENMDPEDMKKMQEMQSSSLSNVLQGRSS